MTPPFAHKDVLLFTFLASNILFSKIYVMQFRTTSSLRALLAIMFPFLSTMSPVRAVRRHHRNGRKSPAFLNTLWDRPSWGFHTRTKWYPKKKCKLNIKSLSSIDSVQLTQWGPRRHHSLKFCLHQRWCSLELGRSVVNEELHRDFIQARKEFWILCVVLAISWRPCDFVHCHRWVRVFLRGAKHHHDKTNLTKTNSIWQLCQRSMWGLETALEGKPVPKGKQH